MLLTTRPTHEAFVTGEHTYSTHWRAFTPQDTWHDVPATSGLREEVANVSGAPLSARRSHCPDTPSPTGEEQCCASQAPLDAPHCFQSHLL